MIVSSAIIIGLKKLGKVKFAPLWSERDSEGVGELHFTLELAVEKLSSCLNGCITIL
ncbi:MAG: hypothetical protein IPH58_14935 [Sphingobacteriales bacterium]|jgi:hypothetical protein|nr:hypothetical protein [Sphingobacteriales bacterium]